MKRIVLLPFFCFMTFICCNQNHQDNNVLCVCILSSTASPCDTYFMEIHKTGQMTVSFGELSDTLLHTIENDGKINVDQMPVLDNIEKQAKRQLNKTEFELMDRNIKELVELPYINDFHPGWWTDAWITIILVDDKQYIFELNEHNQEAYGKLAHCLIELSPIKVSLQEMVGCKTLIELDSLEIQKYEDFWDSQM